MRKHKHEEHANHEAWAIPYADLMTLLLAFFVVMYAVSVVNEGKFRVMSESLIEAFNGNSQTITPSSTEKQPAPTPGPSLSVSQDSHASMFSPIDLSLAQRRAVASRHTGQRADLERIESQVRKALQPLIDRKLVIVRHGPDWLEIEIRTDILFPSGVAQLSTSAHDVLRSLASILAAFGNPLRVEGFTDDVPIATAQYPSNWELSAARAASVARLFAEHGVSPERLGIIGWGEVRPIADNVSADGRNHNRRVVVVVMSDRQTASRPQSDVEHADALPGLVAPSSATAASVSPADASVAGAMVATTAPTTAPKPSPEADLAVLPSVPTLTATAGKGDLPVAKTIPPPSTAVPTTSAGGARLGGMGQRTNAAQ